MNQEECKAFLAMEQESWEGSIDNKYRFTFEREKDTIILRVIGAHNEVLKHP